MSRSPTARTLQRLRAEGCACEVIERWVAAAGIRKDAFGCFDILAIHPTAEPRVRLIQCTSASNVSSRVKKVRARPEVALILAASVSCQVWGWSKAGVKIVSISAEDLEPVVLEQPRRRAASRCRQTSLFDQDHDD